MENSYDKAKIQKLTIVLLYDQERKTEGKLMPMQLYFTDWFLWRTLANTWDREWYFWLIFQLHPSVLVVSCMKSHFYIELIFRCSIFVLSGEYVSRCILISFPNCLSWTNLANATDYTSASSMTEQINNRYFLWLSILIYSVSNTERQNRM